jgi:hypothetical protein
VWVDIGGGARRRAGRGSLPPRRHRLAPPTAQGPWVDTGGGLFKSPVPWPWAERADTKMPIEDALFGKKYGQ